MGSATIRVAIIGVGNCAASLAQGLAHYRDGGNLTLPGLMTADLAGYQPKDIEISTAFDIHKTKVGCDVAQAIRTAPNNTIRFAEVPTTGVQVQRGPTLDSIGLYVSDAFEESELPATDVATALRHSGAEVVVSYLPVGSQLASEFYAEEALKAGCAYVNCIPVFLASRLDWRQRFADRKLPIIGDDIKSQVGATIAHRALANLLRERGVRLDRTYQLNFGGNSDFLNMLERDRLASKKISKTQAVNSQLAEPLSARDIHVGPSDFVPWLEDRKIAHIRLEGTAFGGVPLNLEVKLEVWDSPNSAGVVIDAIRCARVALDRGIGGALVGPSAYFMKSPPRQMTDQEAREQTHAFVRGEAPDGRGGEP